ncbi:Ig-like domain-containing protein [Alloscardovia criceti]|uniref:Ig-like domain-containing protein n=1 Tax=Alloscardovia criceti TaxID=356828 RepID=UPI0003A1567A|nr:Ig-like domain-containing protein [Alloscardovia criceti]
MRRRLVAFISALMLIAGTVFTVSGFAFADDSSATSDSNVELALNYIKQLNDEVRGVQRDALTEQQIADANGYQVANIQVGTGTGKVLDPLQVNSDLMKWAQTRADELAGLGRLDAHANMFNGVPDWAYMLNSKGEKISNMFQNTGYKGGTYIFGPENLANASAKSAFDPVMSWYRELKTGEQGYGHYLAEISQFANVAGFGVAQDSKGAYYGVLELAYDDGSDGHGTTQTVDDALAALKNDSPISSVASPDAVSVSAGEDPTSKLPSTVSATLEDGTTKDVAVSWASVKAEDYNKANSSFTVHGTISGYDAGVDITVNVGAATAKSAANPTTPVSTLEGTAPDLSDIKSTVTWSDGTTSEEPITWSMPEASEFKTPGPVPVKGTVTVDGQPFEVSINVSITARAITSVTLSGNEVTVESGANPQSELDKITAEATWNDGTTSTEKITWAPVSAADYSSRTAKDVSVQGTIAGYAQNITATVHVKAASITKVHDTEAITVPVRSKVTLPETVLVDYSNGESKVSAPVTWSGDVDANTIGDYTLTGTVEGTDLTTILTVHVVEATITSVSNPAGVTAKSGDTEADLTLPEKVTATLSNSETAQVPVAWDTLTDAQKATLKSRQGGTITLNGTVSGTDQKPVLTITVAAATATSVVLNENGDTAVSVKTKNGTAPELPKTAYVTWSNGEATEEEITWGDITKDDYSKIEGGSFEVLGTVAALPNTQLKATVSYDAAEPVEVLNPSIHITVTVGQTPELPNTVTVKWSNGVETEENVQWASYDKTLLDKPGKFTVSGIVTVVKPKTVAKSQPVVRMARLFRVAAAANEENNEESTGDNTTEAHTYLVSAEITVNAAPAPAEPQTPKPAEADDDTKGGETLVSTSGDGKQVSSELARTGAATVGVAVAAATLLYLGAAFFLTSRKKQEE